MNSILRTVFLLIAFGVLFTGCETGDKFVKHKKGVPCDDKGALKTLKSIVDKKFNGDFEILKDEIVVWDYNDVGRYECRAKIKKIGEIKDKKKIATSKNDTQMALEVMSQMFAPAQYGIFESGGWVNYYTYETTTSTQENRNLYVEIFTEDSGI